MDITEKEMNRNAVKNAVKTDITDEERLSDLFDGCITNSEKFQKVRDTLWQINNSGYCGSMAWELSTDSPSAQARYWQMNAERRDVLEREFDRLAQIVEAYIGEKDEDNLPHGRGTKYCQNGGRYEGEWRHGVRCGVGTLYRANGETAYSGEWQNDRYWGKGVSVDYRGIREEGTFSFGNLDLNCDAVVLFPDGRRLERVFTNEKNSGRRGSWLCRYPNGDMLRCDWYGLRYPEGRGVYNFAEGGTLEGYWEKGCKNGVFEYTAPDGTKAKRCYRDDKESSFS